MRPVGGTIGIAWFLSVCCGCATAPTVRLDQGPVQDKLQSLETYVLEDARKFQELLDESGAVYDEPVLQVYLDELTRPLLPQVDPSSPYRIRLKVIRDPTLNAFTLGNGAIYFNTGLIARLTSAEQFAFIMGHEIGHVVNRDLVYFTDSYQRKTVATKLTELVLSPALATVGLSGVGELGLSMAYLASVTGFGREREAAADEESLAVMERLGYDLREAQRIFEIFLAEHERYERGIEISFLSSHPSNIERLKAVKELMGARALDVFAPAKEDAAFLEATQQLRVENAAFNLQLGRYYHAVEDLQVILRRKPEDAAAHFYLAEAYRLIAEDPKKLKSELNRSTWRQMSDIAESEQAPYWQGRAREEYAAAMAQDPQFPHPYRGMGLLLMAQGRPDEALKQFERYLQLSPTAKDRRFVLAQIERVRGIPAIEEEP